MESIVYIVITGIIIGALISAPMGPIGMLVIQRTLNKGRAAAFFTGIGASLSDFLYCLLAGLGMSFVTDFIESNQNVIQVVGSLVLLIFGVYLFRNNPSRNLTAPAEAANTYWKDFVTGFLFTFSNPLILFFIVGLFARFNFLDTNYRFYHYIIGYLCIIAGAIGWWFLVTFFVNKVRAHFNLRSLWLVNRIIAVILLTMATVGIVLGIRNLIH